MARVKLTEYIAKVLLVDDYQGVVIRYATAESDVTQLHPGKKYVLKVDQGVKKRGKRGLIRINVTKKDAYSMVSQLAEQGFERFIAEPMVPHKDDEERYLSIERVREGVRILYSVQGGVEVEEHPELIERFSDIQDVPLPKKFLKNIVKVMDTNHLSFVEINPLIVRGDNCVLLDAAVLADSASRGDTAIWIDDIVEEQQKVDTEETIAALNDGSPASFSFRVLNPDGGIWLLLSGGGASITIADEAANRNKANVIGNYGEYSGGPTREETQIYTEAVLVQALRSSAPNKAIVIAGGVANFTDIKKTFAGIIDAINTHLEALTQSGVKFFVRRGGPNEKEGLAMIEAFLEKHGMLGSVHGSDKVLTVVVDEALDYIDA